MPTYEYRCKACKHEFEKFQSMTAAPVRVCPECGKRKVERLIGTGAALLFKGSGFYITDYRSDSYAKAKEADKPAESKPGGAEKGGEKAPATPASAAKPAASEHAKPKSPEKPAKVKAPANK